MKREQAKKALAFVNIIIKIYYDNSHKFINFFKRIIIYFRLHYKYKISGLSNYKLHNQRADPFKILEKIEKLAYRLKFSSIIIIHSIVLIVQLKFGHSTSNSYEKRGNVDSFSMIKADGNNEKADTKVYEIEILFEKKISRGTPHYLIK